MPERYPLSWPIGWKRTPPGQHQRASFQRHHTIAVTDDLGQRRTRTDARPLSVADGLNRLLGELGRLGVRLDETIISTNVRVRLDGLPSGNAAEPIDVGVAVYFKLKKQDRVLACDQWTRVADNLAAIAQHIDALRRIDRYGVGTLEQAFAGYTALPAKGQTWRTTLGFPPDATPTRADVEAAFRLRARDSHPDIQGGSHDAMASLTAARTEALTELP